MCDKKEILKKIAYEIRDAQEYPSDSDDHDNGYIRGLKIARRFVNESESGMYKKFIEWAKKELEECRIEYRKHFHAKEYELLYIYAGRIRQLEEIIAEHWKVRVFLGIREK